MAAESAKFGGNVGFFLVTLCQLKIIRVSYKMQGGK